jgi:glycosyltransferase involved in cell wall biosynthesis
MNKFGESKKKIAIVIYANPDYYPPIISMILILAKDFDLKVICRNQGRPEFSYPKNVIVYRLGKLKSPREKEQQAPVAKILEYAIFILRAFFYVRYHGSSLVYSYDMHGLICGFIASRLGRKIPLIYHNLELVDLNRVKGLSSIIKMLELRFAGSADKIVFPDTNRASFFQKQAKLNDFPVVAMNTPLRISHLPINKLNEALKERGFDSNTRAVLYQGAINEERCLLEVVRSMPFWAKDTILVFLGIGSPNFIDKLYAQADLLNLRSRIITIPWLLYSEVFSYTIGAYLGLALFKTQDICLRYCAGASNKIYEYISLGIPVIANEDPCFRQTISPSIAYFAHPDSAEDIARIINTALSNKEEYQSKSRAARLMHLNELNYEYQFDPIKKYIAKIAKIYG